MTWEVSFTGKAAKQVGKLPEREQDVLKLLVRDLQMRGPVASGWKNYSKLGKTTHHCHLSYRWVACWRVEDRGIRLIEMYYVGSRKDAPY